MSVEWPYLRSTPWHPPRRRWRMLHGSRLQLRSERLRYVSATHCWRMLICRESAWAPGLATLTRSMIPLCLMTVGLVGCISILRFELTRAGLQKDLPSVYSQVVDQPWSRSYLHEVRVYGRLSLFYLLQRSNLSGSQPCCYHCLHNWRPFHRRRRSFHCIWRRRRDGRRRRGILYPPLGHWRVCPRPESSNRLQRLPREGLAAV